MQFLIADKGARPGRTLDLIKDLWAGDPLTIYITLLAIGFTIFGLWLYAKWMRWRGQRLAAKMGESDFQFCPDGWFGRRVYVISGNKENVNFTITCVKISKGVYHTTVEFSKPVTLSWAKILESLPSEVHDYVTYNEEVNEKPKSVAIVFYGVGCKASAICQLLSHVASLTKS